MSARFQELDFQSTPQGEISLRRRFHPQLEVDVYEVKLGDEHLMSNIFTASERALAHLGLAAHDGEALDVLVGGLGLGYTAVAALDDPRVQRLEVVEAIEAVIGWHRRDLFPDTVGLAADPRCHLVLDDFFARVARGTDERRHDVVLLDVDHTPEHVLSPSHASFYTEQGLRRLETVLEPDGVFALWSDDPPEPGFLGRLEAAFATVAAHVVEFPNPLTGSTSSCTVYVARHLDPSPT